MVSYLALKSFEAKTPTGCKFWKGGEAICLSSAKAANLVKTGLLVEAHVGMDLLASYEARVKTLRHKLGYSVEEARVEALALVISCLKRHESTKNIMLPSPVFLEEVAEFNRTATGTNPVKKIKSKNGAGEWAGYNCNIGRGCSHGCLYCYAQKRASRFKQIPSPEAWLNEQLKAAKTTKCKNYMKWIMFPTTHDITETYLSAYRCHLYNVLKAGNNVLLVTKPHMVCMEAICSEFSSFRDNMVFRFSIGGLDNERLIAWEPGAPSLEERLGCLKYVFEQGFKTSISAEPMLVDGAEAERFYYSVEPLVTENIWFGKMNNVGSFRKSQDPVVAKMATDLFEAYKDENILQFVDTMRDLPKVEWKDSVIKVIEKTKTENKI